MNKICEIIKKKLISSIELISIFLFGCYKTDPAVEELLKQMQTQNDALKMQVTAMHKSSDSIAIILKASISNSINMDKKLIQPKHNKA